MKMLRKISALVLAIMMIAVVGAVWADDGNMTGEDGVIGEFESADTPTTYTDIVYLYKEIKAYNESASVVNAPAITYCYTIASDTTVSTTDSFVKDAGGSSLHVSEAAVQVKVKPGIGSPTIAGSVNPSAATPTYVNGQLAFTTDVQFNTSPAGTANRFPLKVDFSSVNWTGAGIYRYVITETVNTGTTDTESTGQKNLAGIADGTISNMRYLDVYVKDGTPTQSGDPTYDVYGYVCFQNESANIDATTGSSVTAAAKTEGFVADKGSDGTTDLTADQFYTFNLKVGKTLSGDQAMNDNDFPFFVNIMNNTVTADVKLITSHHDVEASTTDTAGTLAGNLSTKTSEVLTGIADAPTIDHQSYMEYIGIPVGITGATSATVYEKNNVTGTTYISEFSIDEDTALATRKKMISWVSTEDANKSIVANWAQVTMNQANTATNHSIQFTNTLEQISPTGYVSRFAPYALILVGGIVLLIIAKKRKPAKDDEE